MLMNAHCSCPSRPVWKLEEGDYNLCFLKILCLDAYAIHELQTEFQACEIYSSFSKEIALTSSLT